MIGRKANAPPHCLLLRGRLRIPLPVTAFLINTTRDSSVYNTPNVIQEHCNIPSHHPLYFIHGDVYYLIDCIVGKHLSGSSKFLTHLRNQPGC